jgi:serine/threonine-protein kinase
MLLFYHRVRLRGETGRPAEAARVAGEYLTMRAALPKIDQAGVPWDVTVYMAATARRGGVISDSEFKEKRAEWLGHLEDRTEQGRAEAWLMAYALPAATPEEAKEALDALPTHTISLYRAFPSLAVRAEAALGKVYLLAGAPKEAIVHLRPSAAACSNFEFTLDHVAAKAHLGMALEATGDKEGACGAYQSVLARWGGTKESTTAREVARRAKGLGCG